MNRDEVAVALTAAAIEPGYSPTDIVDLYVEILALLPAQQNQPLPVSATPRNDGPDNDWEDVIANPSNWWDNRENKKNPKGPDFSHKTRIDPSSGYKVGLWLHDAPEGVKERLGVAQVRTGPGISTRPPQYLPDEEPF